MGVAEIKGQFRHATVNFAAAAALDRFVRSKAQTEERTPPVFQNGTDRTDSNWLAPASNNLTALRLLAAVCVAASHCALLRSGSEAAEPLANLNCFNLGDHALNVFFFISGLTVAASLSRSSSLLDFALARALRLWPGFIAVVLLTAVAAGPLVSAEPAAAYFANPAWLTMLAKTALLSGSIGDLPGVFAANPLPHIVNGSPWTLKFEALCYLALALGTASATHAGASARKFWLPASTAAAGVAMMVWPAANAASTFDHALRFWFAFGLGASAFSYRARLAGSIDTIALSAALAGTAFVYAIGSRFECVAAVLCTSAAVLYAARWRIGPLRGAANRTDLSYGVYLTAWPITQWLVSTAPSLSYAALFAACLTMSLALAYLSWTWIEKPALGLKRRSFAGMARRDHFWLFSAVSSKR